MIDVLLMAYAKSEKRFDEDEEMSAEQFIESFRSNLGMYLKNYVKTQSDNRTCNVYLKRKMNDKDEKIK